MTHLGIGKVRIWWVVGTNCVENLDFGLLSVGDFWVGRNPFCLIQRKTLDVRGTF